MSAQWVRGGWERSHGAHGHRAQARVNPSHLVWHPCRGRPGTRHRHGSQASSHHRRGRPPGRRRPGHGIAGRQRLAAGLRGGPGRRAGGRRRARLRAQPRRPLARHPAHRHRRARRLRARRPGVRRARTSAPSCAGSASGSAQSPFQLLLTMAANDRDRANVATYLTEQHVDGVLLLSLHAPRRPRRHPRRARRAHGLRRSRWPASDPPCVVDVDNRAGRAAAVEHLLAAGRRRIARAHRARRTCRPGWPGSPAPARRSRPPASTTRASWSRSATTARPAASARCAQCSLDADPRRMPCSPPPT